MILRYVFLKHNIKFFSLGLSSKEKINWRELIFTLKNFSKTIKKEKS